MSINYASLIIYEKFRLIIFLKYYKINYQKYLILLILFEWKNKFTVSKH
jgi:hypothetical protein